MKRLLAVAISMILTAPVLAADYSLTPVPEGPPADALSPEIAAQIGAAGVKVMKGGTRTVGTLWLAKSWPAKTDFKPSSTVLYPLEVGQLIGVLALKNKGSDFRGQEIASGVYTVRYALQPVDGNHVGTSVTRDFLVLLPADQDKHAAPVAEKDLFKLSAMAAGTNHPAMLALMTAEKAAAEPTLKHLEEPDWWVLQVNGQGQAGGKAAPLPLSLVIVGKAAE